MTTAKELWTKLKQERDPYLRRALDCAAVTLPFLVTEMALPDGSDIPRTFTSVGAKGVNNLASKLSLSLFPVGAPAFQYDPNPQLVEEDPEVQAEVEQTLRKREMAITRDMETRGHRAAIYETLRHALVAGTCVLYSPDSGRPKVFSLPEFVVDFDGMGGLQDLVIAQEIDREEVPKGVDVTNESGRRNDTVQVLTWIHRTDDDKYLITSEIEGTTVKTGSRTVSLDRLPYKVVRLNHATGETYGRSFVEDHLGNLRTLEGLSQAVLEATAASATSIFLVNPMGMTNIRRLLNAKNGDYIPGRPDDVAPMDVSKALDLRVAQELIGALSRDIQSTFLMASSVQRDAERVTATEIQGLIRELEGSLGGIYSNLTSELQLPLIKLSEARLEEGGLIEDLASQPDLVEVRIVTGVESLGRSQELGRLQTAAGLLSGLFGPEHAAQFLEPLATSRQVFISAGLDPDKYVMSDEKLQERQQQEQTQRAVSELGPSVVREIGASSRET